MEINNLRMSEFKAYLSHIVKIEAERNLVRLNISDYSNMKQENREKLYRALDKQANPDRIVKTITTTQFARKRDNGNGKTAS